MACLGTASADQELFDEAARDTSITISRLHSDGPDNNGLPMTLCGGTANKTVITKRNLEAIENLLQILSG
ncbi:hypothetical protein CS8_098680 [Cupriavidus sp. 8B]